MSTETKDIPRVPVASSNVSSIGYDEESNTLHVEFSDGRVYAYRGVPKELHADLMTAPSKGSFLNQRIKGAYEHERVR